VTTSAIHGDTTRRVVVRTADLPWQASPAAGVWRKRLHRVGAEESGQVTSLVRFDAGSSFAEHGHPDGEEILVLEGTFSDEEGDWGPGSYLLNPEGSRHTPFTHTGCELFVKLQQYAGPARCRLEIDTAARPWQPTVRAGIEEKVLYQDRRFPDRTRLERWAPGTAGGERLWSGGVEIFVLEGELLDERETYEHGTWLRLPPASTQRPRTGTGCLLYVKEGAVSWLRSEPGSEVSDEERDVAARPVGSRGGRSGDEHAD
jgi:anti-sigma factor ChrR (cupin superfamily)